jgi:hypothetical protein
MKLINVAKSLILEASAKDVLVNKMGLTDKAVDFFVERCGKLAVMMVNKIIKYNLQIMNIEDTPTKSDILKATHWVNINYRTFSEDLVSIMDWIRVGLNGNLGEHKNDDFVTLFNESRKWHNELEVGDGEYNYNEENEVILDFRDGDGMGFYWVDLKTSKCSEEQERMGHCASTGGDTLCSLRETKRINDKFTLSKSHLTAAIEREYTLYKQTGDIILQLKGQKNSKPAQKYHKYIVELLISDELNIIGFGSEYDSASDFKISDLGEESLKVIMEKKPQLLDIFSRVDAYKKGFIKEKPETTFDITIKNHEYKYFLENFDKWNEEFLEKMFNGDLYNDSGYSWEDFVHYTDNSLEQKIEDYVDNIYRSKKWSTDDSENNQDEFYDMELSEKIKEIDDEDLQSALAQSLDRAYETAVYDAYYNRYKSLFEEYGDVLEFNDEYVKIHSDILNFTELKNFPYLAAYNNSLEDLFFDAATTDQFNYKPRVDISGIDAYPDNDVFVENFYELCSEYDIPIKK